MFHAGLESWWSCSIDTDRLPRAIAAVLCYAEANGADVDEFMLIACVELMKGYDARWGGQEYQTLAVEQQFSMPLVNPKTGKASRTFRLSGKIDGIATCGKGHTWLVEHKTTTKDISPGSVYWRKLNMDSQVSQYYDGAASLGHAVDGCLYDVAVRPTLKPYRATPLESRKFTRGKLCKRCLGHGCPECQSSGYSELPRLYSNQRAEDETPSEYRLRVREHIAGNPQRYFQRGVVRRIGSEMEDFRADTWDMARTLRESQLAMRRTRNPDACERFNSLCSFFGVCTGEADIDNPHLFTIRDTPHPELA